MFVINVWSLPAKLKVLSFASIAGIAAVDVIPGEIESEVIMVSSCDVLCDSFCPSTVVLDVLENTDEVSV